MGNQLPKNSSSVKLLMVRPVQFGLNLETTSSNAFQQQLPQFKNWQINQLAQLEFDNFVQLLKTNNIDVLVYDDNLTHYTPDSIFPNNWLMTTAKRALYTFPMAAVNRRLERRADILKDLVSLGNYQLNESLLAFEEKGRYLEGTGSLVLDRLNKIAYAALSPRTNEEVLLNWAAQTNYTVVSFHAYGPKQEEIYHTNVMLCIADNYVMIGSQTIAPKDRDRVLKSLKSTNHKIIELSNEQIYEHFAGNALQVYNKDKEPHLILSARADRSLTSSQKQLLTTELKQKIIAPPLHIIETIGGGSARCMLAEIVF